MASTELSDVVRVGAGTVRPGGSPRRRGPTEPGARSARYGRWRAATLISIYLLFGIHIAHWKLAGSTLAPLELNEVMYTLEAGVVTAGFLLMATLFVASAVFGRFFCSWACHILALEDLCAWILGKLRIRVQPVRSRMLMLVPPIALLYMFVWPQVLRVMEGRPFPRWRVLTDADGWASFVTNDFWRNLPGPWVAGATFVVCGFAMVYVLGSRSFCFHACPYGAVFSFVDRFAPGRIKLTGDCLQCATCTAVCTSHVRVHEEIALYGKVVDSNCMKDLDCVASCPQDALSYGFTRPAPLASFSRSGRRAMKYGFSATEDVVMAVAFVATLLVFRGLYMAGPFLMALGLGAIVAYLTVTSLRLADRPDVRFIRFRLKRDGALTSSGRLFVTAALLFAALFLHSAFIRYHEFRGQQAFERVQAAMQQSPDHVSPALLVDATRHLSLSRRWGLLRPLARDHQLASLQLNGTTPALAAPYLERIVRDDPEDADSRLALARILAREGQLDQAKFHAQNALESVRIAAGSERQESGSHPIDETRAHELLARIHLATGETNQASAEFGAVLEREPGNVDVRVSLAALLTEQGRFGDAAEHLRLASAMVPDSAELQYNLAVTLAASGDERSAVESYRRALTLAPDDVDTLNNLAFLLIRTGELREAETLLKRAIDLSPDFAHAQFNLGGVYEQLGDLSRARAHFRNAARLDPTYAGFLGAALD